MQVSPLTEAWRQRLLTYTSLEFISSQHHHLELLRLVCEESIIAKPWVRQVPALEEYELVEVRYSPYPPKVHYTNKASQIYLVFCKLELSPYQEALLCHTELFQTSTPAPLTQDSPVYSPQAGERQAKLVDILRLARSKTR